MSKERGPGRARLAGVVPAVVAAALAAGVLVAPGCDGAPGAGGWPDLAFALDTSGRSPETLVATGLVRWDAAAGTLEHHPQLVPYELNTPLFSDYTAKRRALWIPDGTAATYTDSGVLELPVGSVIVKTFLMPADLRTPDQDLTPLETRVLLRTAEGWDVWPYLWRDDRTDADRHVSGQVLGLAFTGLEGEAVTADYLVPQRNQCKDCHVVAADDPGGSDVVGDGDGDITPIGPTARNLRRLVDDLAGPGTGAVDQLAYLESLGKLEGLPPLDTIEAAYDFDTFAATDAETVAATLAAMDDAEVERAARDYLDVNCAHCHNPRGVEGETSQLYLDYATTDLYDLGVCKPPGSAGKGGVGRKYDIVPGDPDASILVYRMWTEDLGAMMPDIGRSLPHDAGVQLVAEWVRRMDGPSCD